MNSKPRILFGILALLFTTQISRSQTASGNLSQENTTGDPGFYVVQRGPHSKTLERVETVVGPRGEQRSVIHRYEELATGLSWFDSQTKRWEDADESFEVTPEGYAIARRTQHQLIISPVLNDAEGNVDIQTPDGKRLRSTVLALNIHNEVTGDDLLLAEVSANAVGHLVASNEIVFSNAFPGFADVRVLNSKGEIHQDLLLNAALDLKQLEAAGFPAGNSSLEFWTEFLEAPAPAIESRVLGQNSGKQNRPAVVSLSDRLDFGTMKMPGGKLYLKGGSGKSDEISVVSRWMTINNRRFIVESVPLFETQKMFSHLRVVPLPGSSNDVEQARIHDIRAHPPQIAGTYREGKMIQTAQAVAPRASSVTHAFLSQETPVQVVLDPVTVNGSLTNVVFKGDTTYYVSATLNLYGSNVLEGGTCLKFPGNIYGVLLYGSLNCQTATYRPALFTSKDDNSVGETISGSSGSPEMGTLYTYLTDYSSNTNLALRHIRFSFAGLGIYGNNFEISDAQFVQCNYALMSGGNQESDVVLRNVLFSHCNYMLAEDLYSITTRGEHLTVEQCSNLASADGNGYFTNSLFANVTSLSYSPGSYAFNGSDNGFYNAPQFGNATHTNTSYPFQSVGGGNYYLANGNSFRDAGSTNINPAMLADLRKLTTFPPTVYSNVTITTNLTLALQAQRDTDAPDLGYHYPPLDYLVRQFYVQNITLTLSEGVAVAAYGSGLYASSSGSTLISSGTAMAQNQLCFSAAVQEQSAVPSVTYLMSWHGGKLEARFTDLSGIPGAWTLADGYEFEIKLRDCRIGPGSLSPNSPWTIQSYTNNIFDRVNLQVGTFDYICPLYFYNNTVRNSSVTFDDDWYVNDRRTVRNNLFDNSTLSVPYPSLVNYDHNAYYQSTTALSQYHSGDTNLVSLSYASGPLGNFYLTTPALFDAGNTNAQLLGLYHFTTQTNQVKETNSPVDIGYHYVALNSSGRPIDSDMDGLPDYAEDRNGDGSYNARDVADWQTTDTDGDGISDGTEVLQGRNPLVLGVAPDTNGIVRLQVYTPLK